MLSIQIFINNKLSTCFKNMKTVPGFFHEALLNFEVEECKKQTLNELKGKV